MSSSMLQAEAQRAFVILPEARPLLAAVKRVAKVLMCEDVVSLLSQEETERDFLFTLQELTGSHKMLTLLVSYYSSFGQFMFRGDVTMSLGRQSLKLVEALSCVLARAGKPQVLVAEQGPVKVTDVIANGQVLRSTPGSPMLMSEVRPTEISDSFPIVQVLSKIIQGDQFFGRRYGDDLEISQSRPVPFDGDLRIPLELDGDMPALEETLMFPIQGRQATSGSDNATALRHPSFPDMAAFYAETYISDKMRDHLPGFQERPTEERFRQFLDLHRHADKGVEVEMLSMPELVQKEDLSYTMEMVSRRSPFTQTVAVRGKHLRVVTLEEMCLIASYQGYHRRFYRCILELQPVYMLCVSPLPLSMHFEGLTIKEIMQMMANEKQPIFICRSRHSKSAIVEAIHDFTLLSPFFGDVVEQRIDLYHDLASMSQPSDDQIVSSVVGWANGQVHWSEYEKMQVIPGVLVGVKICQEDFMALQAFKDLKNGQKHQYLCYYHVLRSSYQQFKSITFFDELVRSHRTQPRDTSLVAEEILREIRYLSLVEVAGHTFRFHGTEEELVLMSSPSFQVLSQDERRVALMRFRTVVASIEGCWHVLESLQRNDISDDEGDGGMHDSDYENYSGREYDSDRGQSDYEARNEGDDYEEPVHEEYTDQDEDHWW